MERLVLYQQDHILWKDGAKLTIDDDGKILDLGEEKEAEDVEAEEEDKEEMAEEADVADWKGMEIRIPQKP